ncbi:immunoresponsive gene 1, like [Denticeps clupeoides]|uniref:Cis-aconitate decarboxylase n=1 Tax=Denticeps clupeoides TaxID=299321 RepID=A0AAY4D9P5_9TELE|nr:cis-aconitate decarboxylase-like [Denticeps clupeoides]XP_028816831.1 cis-aconitate decarboxylase-like [Denticeps clupeoides]XP_028816832.1 cis-aconitate decarboxylase-like [Denticeps clupeoides]XP_028816833.1 cis-aconitate decarboxylase-like [Denticeps clupeoides]
MLSKAQKTFRPLTLMTVRALHKSALDVVERPAPEETVTSSFGRFIQGVQPYHLTPTVLRRSKRMVLDSLGVSLVGSNTEVFELALQHCQHMYARDDVSSVYGREGTRLSPTLAAFVNGVAAHSMDFDDTWHPATHPSGAVLPALLAISDMMPGNGKPSGLELLVAFNVGIEVQGRLMRFSSEARNIPKRFHPPTVVGTMGSAAASARLLSLDRTQCSHALAIAASLSGAPMANAATQSKPFHIGNAARLGLEAALLASRGLEASPLVLDAVPGVAGFSAFYEDYAPRSLVSPDEEVPRFLLEEQDMGFKRFPAHLGMHWVADAAAKVHETLVGLTGGTVPPHLVQDILLRVPPSKYINRPFPESEHQARHSFQFNACTALLDGEVTVQSFSDAALSRPDLHALLSRVRVEHPADNRANFDCMYAEVEVTLMTGDVLKGRCDTFYGHWRNPLSDDSLRKKFRNNASTVLSPAKVEGLIAVVEDLERLEDCKPLLNQIQ